MRNFQRCFRWLETLATLVCPEGFNQSWTAFIIHTHQPWTSLWLLLSTAASGVEMEALKHDLAVLYIFPNDIQASFSLLGGKSPLYDLAR